MPQYIARHEQDTCRLAHTLAQSAQTGDIFTLTGDLGAGKSTFARAFIQSLLGPIDVPSPTFTLVQTYESPAGPIHHFDLYRLEDPDEVLELGWDEALSDGICLIEWPGKAGAFLPTNTIQIIFTTLADESRKIDIHDPRTR